MSDIIYIDNQPIQFYKQNPTDSDLADGMTAWAQTAYHKRLGNCGFIGPQYCHPVENTDFMTFQFKVATTGDPVFDPIYDSIYLYDQNTSVVVDQLVDSGATFITDGVEVDELVVSYDNVLIGSSFVQNVASETVLDLDDDVFTATHHYYGISTWKGAGEWRYNGQTNKLSMTTPSPTDFYLENALVVDTWYKVTIKVDSVTAGNFQVKLGTNSIATISSVGTHTLYGKCEGNTTFKLTASSAFVGVISDSVGESIEVTAIETAYTIGIFDLDGNYINAISPALDEAPLSIGNAVINIEWGNFALECGRYIAGVFIGDVVPCTGEMITNGAFASATGWTVGTNIQIISGHAEFLAAPADAALVNALSCPIFTGRSYTLTWDIAAHDAVKEGQYIITTPVGIAPTYDAALQSGTQTVTFTATSNQSTLSFICVDECTFELDNVTLVCNDPEISQEDADGLSECLCVCDTQDCTILVKFTADRNTFGNYFDADNQEMYFRVTARLRNVQPEDIELNEFKSTLDYEVQPYNNNRNAEELAVSSCPEWVHKSLKVALSHPIVKIESVRYARLGEYSPAWNDNGEVAMATCKVAKRTQTNLRNNY